MTSDVSRRSPVRDDGPSGDRRSKQKPGVVSRRDGHSTSTASKDISGPSQVRARDASSDSPAAASPPAQPAQARLRRATAQPASEAQSRGASCRGARLGPRRDQKARVCESREGVKDSAASSSAGSPSEAADPCRAEGASDRGDQDASKAAAERWPTSMARMPRPPSCGRAELDGSTPSVATDGSEQRGSSRGAAERRGVRPRSSTTRSCRVEPGAALDLLDRRRHGQLRQRPPLPEPEHAAARRTRSGSRSCSTTSPTTTRRPTGDDPFAVHVEVAGCPWNAGHRLARIGLTGKPIDQRRAAAEQPRLPDRRLRLDGPAQQAAAGQGGAPAAGRAARRERPGRDRRLRRGRRAWSCPRPRASHKAEILAAIDQLQAGGSTNGGAGIQLAYDIGRRRTSSRAGPTASSSPPTATSTSASPTEDELVRLIEAKAKSGVFLSVLGFGMGNLKDGTLEKLADKGNGHYAYIDTLEEAHKVLVERDGRDARHDRQGRQDPGRVQPGARSAPTA